MKPLCRKLRAAAALLLLLLALPAGLGADDLITLRVQYSDGRAYTRVNAVERLGVTYIAAEDLSRLLDLGFIRVPGKQKCVLKAGSRGVTVTALNPFILVDDHPYQMALPTLLKGEKIYVPLAIFLAVCRDFLPASPVFDQRSKVLSIRKTNFNITSVDIEERENGTLIRLSTAENFSKKDIEVILNGNWLYITFMNGTLDTLNLASERAIGTVRRIKSIQYTSSAQISFLLQSGVTGHNLFVNDREVMISLRRTIDIKPPERQSSGTPTPAPADRKKWLIDTIVIDPGHGGPDPGAVGRVRKVKEKDVNLAIATRLADLLKQNLDVRVLMTRTGDKRLKNNYREDLLARSKFANANGGKLFISIHANSAPSTSARGFSVYILGQSSSQKAIEVAKRENSVIDDTGDGIDSGGTGQLSHILNANAHNAYQKESLDLAAMMVSEVKKRTKLPLWTDGVEQANFWVLNGTAMPSVLVETAFLSNQYEERLLNTRSEQMKIARALYESIAQFKAKYEKEIGTS